ESCIEHVIEHLWELGHRHIDCINTQNRNPEIDRRIDLWDRWMVQAGGSGKLHDDPTPVFTDPTAVAYRLMSRLLEGRTTKATAFVATTCPAAIGSIRACYEQGVAVGDEVSIAAMNLEPPAEYFCPSITGLQTPDLTPSLNRCFDWFTSGKKSWTGPLLLEPDYSTLFEGESTARRKPTRSLNGVS
ncbi:MAG: substrate-binding domain-containing protein, partial [Pseudomonadota bacterium]